MVRAAALPPTALPKQAALRATWSHRVRQQLKRQESGGASRQAEWASHQVSCRDYYIEARRIKNERPPEVVAFAFYDLRALNIEVLDIQSVVFDELASRFYVFAHQDGEDVVGLDHVFELYLHQRAAGRVHRRIP